MKKILFLSLLTLCFMVSCNETKAQNATAQIQMYKCTALQSGITTQTNDSLTNTETTYFNVRSGALAKYSTNKYGFIFTADTTSGTPVTVSVIAQGSYDGITWFNLSGVALGTDGVNCDSLQLTAGSQILVQSKITELGGCGKYANSLTQFNCSPRVPYIRLKFVQASGTVNLVISSVYCIPFNNF